MRPPAKPEPTVEALCERFLEVERSIQLARSLDLPERAPRLNDLAHERRDVLACAASRLPAKGPTAQWFHDALEGAWGEPTQHFAIYVACAGIPEALRRAGGALYELARPRRDDVISP